MDVSRPCFENCYSKLIAISTIIQKQNQDFTINRVRIGVKVMIRVRYLIEKEKQAFVKYTVDIFRQLNITLFYEQLSIQTTAASNNCQIEQLFSNSLSNPKRKVVLLTITFITFTKKQNQ